ncbi:MAG: helix-turn-helix transcriptional regulator [Oscillospiraceae bacterium]|nr:helix-turn-helix transcriptional regulator [Oscillospiraceae bacterium]
MELNELRLICAGNLISLRTRQSMTQAELGAKLNYTDKNISKWERGEALPDAFALTRIAEIYGVTVDYLLSSHDTYEAPSGMPVSDDAPTYRASIIVATAVLSIMTSALLAFVVMWILGNPEWRVFLLGLSLSAMTGIVLDCLLYKARGLAYVISAFVLSLFPLAYFTIPSADGWKLFLLAVPSVAIVFLACNIRRKPKKSGKNKTK